MDKRRNKIKSIMILNWIPFLFLIVLHVIGTFTTIHDRSHIAISLLGCFIITVIAIALGEGYGAIAFLISGYVQKWYWYLITIILCVVSMFASFLGQLFASIEVSTSRWMSYGFIIVDILIMIAAIVQWIIVQANKK